MFLNKIVCITPQYGIDMPRSVVRNTTEHFSVSKSHDVLQSDYTGKAPIGYDARTTRFFITTIVPANHTMFTVAPRGIRSGYTNMYIRTKRDSRTYAWKNKIVINRFDFYHQNWTRYVDGTPTPWSWMIDSHTLSSNANRPSHSQDKAISNSDLENSSPRWWVCSKGKIAYST